MIQINPPGRCRRRHDPMTDVAEAPEITPHDLLDAPFARMAEAFGNQ